MEYSLSNSLVGGSGSLNLDKLSLDLQFATDKTLTARRGPTPAFTRASGNNKGVTYVAPSSINTIYSLFGSTYNVDVVQDLSVGVLNGRFRWANGDTSFIYSGTTWGLTHDGNTVATSAPTEAYRPDLANWSGTGATVVASSTIFGIVNATNNEPRFDYDPLTGLCRGLLIEESRTNLVFPSAALTTQTRTVTAVAHTLSFYGTGTVVLSGVAVATVTGTAAFPTRTTLTFTPTAGSLILTVTGDVTEAQLEAGAFATSYIPTTTIALERTADVCSITGSAFTGMYNSLAGTIVAGHFFRSNGAGRPFYIGDGTSATNIIDAFCGSLTMTSNVYSGGTQQYSQSVAAANNTMINTALAVTASSAMLASNGTLATAGGGLMPVGVDRFIIGNRPDGLRNINGHISSIRYFKKRLPNAKLQTLTT
jgi:hypothetical protein